MSVSVRPASPRDVLIAAKALIPTPRKWGKGKYKNPHTGRLCAIGALIEVRGGVDGTRVPVNILMTATIPPGVRPDHFNDAPKRTHADIMAWFDRAIEAAS